jgi:colicin import membrane protein
MKKVFLAVIAFLGFAMTSSAQQGVTKTAKKTEKAANEVKKETKTVLKKDGTPDKRYKQAEAPKAVLKKDGTPDKRYKEKK